jgi:hypothetical protein
MLLNSEDPKGKILQPGDFDPKTGGRVIGRKYSLFGSRPVSTGHRMFDLPGDEDESLENENKIAWEILNKIKSQNIFHRLANFFKKRGLMGGDA